MKKVFLFIVVFAFVFAFPLRCVAAVDAETVISDAGGAASSETPSNLVYHALSLIFSAFSENGKSIIAHCGGILAVCVCAGVMNSFKSSFPAVGSAGEYVSILALSAASFSAVNAVTVLVKQATMRFSQYLLSLLPVMTAMYVYGGSTGAAVSNATSIDLFCTVITVICNTVLTPLINVCLILSLTAAIPGCGSVQPIANGVKNLSASLTAFVFSILGFAVSVQTVISAAGDSYASRTVRFASGVFIPVIGNMVGEASRTVISAVAKAKSVIGFGGITALLTIVVPPAAVVVMYKLVILFCASSAKMLGCEKEAHLLYDINGIFGVLLAVMIGASLVGLLAITVFVCAGAKV